MKQNRILNHIIEIQRQHKNYEELKWSEFAPFSPHFYNEQTGHAYSVVFLNGEKIVISTFFLCDKTN